jgi:peptide/nickel transport system permease protein
MRGYIVRRLILIVPTILIVSMIAFGTMRFIPGTVVELMSTEMSRESQLGYELTTEHIKHQLGLDLPIHVQYGHWVRDIFQNELGKSLWTNASVGEELAHRIPVSFELGIFALITVLIISFPVGIVSAIRQDTFIDYLARSISILAISIPSFWLATMIIVYPSIWWGWAPPVEYIPFVENPIGNLKQFALPGLLLGMAMTGTSMRMTRTMMLEVLRQDYIRTAWAKGLKERVVILRHALRNAMIPVVSMIGLLVPIVIGGSIVIEHIFSLPGVGLYTLEAITRRDYPVISGINLALACFVLIMNLIVDLSYAYLDPRIQYR